MPLVALFRGRYIVDSIGQDVRFGLRTFRKNPGFTFVAIVTLALGIGANTAIFSVVHTVLVRPLPFRNAERLVSLYENIPAAESPNGRVRRIGGIDVRELIELRARTRALSQVAAQGIALVSVSGGVDVVQRELTLTSASLFPMLAVQPILGRWLTSDDERPGNDHVIVLSYGAWQRYFGRDARALGKTLAFNGNSFSSGVTLGVAYTVVGVMPPGFHFPDDSTEFWAPLTLTLPTDGRQRRVTMVARVADGASLDQAIAEISAVAREVRGGAAPTVNPPFEPARFGFARVQDQVGASVKTALIVLTAAVGFVLLIACANIANLMLARTVARQREIAVRVSLGAGRARLIRQLLTESLLLAAAGGAVGTVLAAGGVQLFRNLATDLARIDLGSLGQAFPRLDAITINAPAFVFAMAVSIGTGILAGLLPAFRYGGGAPIDVLRATTGATAAPSGFHRRLRTQDLLVVAQITLATLLFVGGSLFIHSFVKLARVDLGYDPSNVLTFQVGLPGARRPAAELKAFAEDLVARLQSIPGVEATAYANQVPLVALENSLTLRTSPAPVAPSPSPDAPDVRLVSRDYLKAMGIRVVAGRTFGSSDGVGSPRVLLINRTLARRDFADRNPVGTSVYVGRDPIPWEIIGIVDDVRQSGLDRAPRPQVFVNMTQWTGPGVPIFPAGTYYAVRATASPASVIAHVRDVIHRLDPQASLENIATMDQIISNRMTRPRLYAVLLGLFAGVALTLAAAGIYGVLAYAVLQRTREIGIRMALGAARHQVLMLILRQSAALTVVGLFLGLTGAAMTTQYLEGMLFGLTPLDPTTFVVVAVAFVGVAMLASFVPARRATSVDPTQALRSE